VDDVFLWNAFCDTGQFHGYEKHDIYIFYGITLLLILMIDYLTTYMTGYFNGSMIKTNKKTYEKILKCNKRKGVIYLSYNKDCMQVRMVKLRDISVSPNDYAICLVNGLCKFH
jgi:hypothetical protein